MDNYKIKVKDEAESKEAQELFFELGYKLYEPGRARLHKVNWISSFDDGDICLDANDVTDHKELTFPQLRDLVVLKRNDEKDANFLLREDHYYRSSRGDWYFYGLNGWKHSTLTDIDGIEPINQPQDPALISGADALRALADGKEVEFKDGTEKWENIKYHMNLDLSMFLTSPEWMMFRLKPTTLKVNAELPKPHKETQQNTEVYAVTYEFKTREERNAFADKLRGTNS